VWRTIPQDDDNAVHNKRGNAIKEKSKISLRAQFRLSKLRFMAFNFAPIDGDTRFRLNVVQVEEKAENIFIKAKMKHCFEPCLPPEAR